MFVNEDYPFRSTLYIMALESDVKSVEFLLNHGANTELKVQIICQLGLFFVSTRKYSLPIAMQSEFSKGSEKLVSYLGIFRLDFIYEL